MSGTSSANELWRKPSERPHAGRPERCGEPNASQDPLQWRIFIDERRSAAEHMALDERLAREAIPTARLYTWHPPAVSLGCRQPIPGWLAASSVERVERPTGGGIALHGSDLSLAVIVPRAFEIPLESLMRAVCESAARLCRAYGAEATALLHAPGNSRITYCLAETSSYAVLIGGRKVAGVALRRYPESWLIQGSLLIRPMPQALHDAMPEEVLSRFSARAIALSAAATRPVDEQFVARQWAEHWAPWWGNADSRGDACGLPRTDQRESALALQSAGISVR